MSNTESNQNTVEWENIDWRKVERYVFKLQKRIYAASRRGEVKKVRKLQRTLMRSWSNKVLSVRKVTQDNRGKKTAGVDGAKALSPEERMNLVGQLKITGKSKPTRRVWIPKQNSGERRPLGIPTIYDRALQNTVKSAIEPEWEARFESNSYGFRPGRSVHDAIKQIKNAIQKKPKYVLDADIAKCFDKINHLSLLKKLGYTGKIRQQIKAWLKSGVIDQKVFTTTSEGTPQGGVISPLLANIALHGIEIMLKEFVKTLDLRRKDYPSSQISWQKKVRSLSFIRYADDFLLIHEDLKVVHRCKELISEWLYDIGLELKPSKTRITHILKPELSEDRKAGFDFLGHHIQQYPISKYQSAKLNGKPLGFRTLITPSKEARLKHQKDMRDIVRKHKNSHQAKLIKKLNECIRGWCNYYVNSDAQTVGEFSRQDHLVYQKLRTWGKRRCKGSLNKAHKKYWCKVGNNNWVFAVNQETKNPLRLLTHSEYKCSSTNYVKVKDDVSPFNGDLVYWSTRMGKSPEMPNRKAKLLKIQKGVCPWCQLRFREEDVLEVDHIQARALGGKDTYKNLQLLHGHCHDEKTALDMKEIWKHKTLSDFLKSNNILENYNWYWDENDILITFKKIK